MYWRVVYWKNPKAEDTGAGPWHQTRDIADKWLAMMKPFYPEAHAQSMERDYQKEGTASNTTLRSIGVA